MNKTIRDVIVGYRHGNSKEFLYTCYNEAKAELRSTNKDDVYTAAEKMLYVHPLLVSHREI
jgi:hypothetical protein